MSSFAQYKVYKAKSTTPLTWFNCAYCGKYQSRRTSKIKNPNLIFCDNTCRAKYVSKKANSFHFSNEDIQPYLFEFKEEINMIASYVAKEYKILDILDILKREAPFCIFKCLQNKKSNKISKPYFCKYYKRYLKSYIIKYELCENYYSIDFFDNIDKIIDIAYFSDLDNSMDAVKAINVMLQDLDKLPMSCKLAIDRYIYDLDIDYLMKKYDMTRRQVVYNCSKGKELLRLKYDN